MINGIINIYKEPGFTSHDVVAKLRGIVKQKKIGHTGTLDPDAVGVLPVCFGNATKLCDMLTDKTKEYEACMLLGVTTDTQDISGEVLSQKEVVVTEAEVIAAIESFVGEYDQIPPMYSAIKVDGKKLYELARQGKVIERQARKVEIHSIKILEVNLPEVRFLVGCSKGTYIRTLCQDIGDKLGCGATMKALKRTRVGNFHVDQAITLKQVEEYVANGTLNTYVLESDQAFLGLKKAHIKREHAKSLANGNKLFLNQLFFEEKEKLTDGEQVLVYDENKVFTGLYANDESEHCLKPVKMFFAN